jgi:hypothetical protein
MLDERSVISLTEMQQGSDAWLQARLGRITGTGFVKLCGTPAARQKYLYSKAAEILTQNSSDSDSNVSSIHIERGRECEAIARNAYKQQNIFASVSEVAMVTMGEYVSCSPDGLVDDDGLIEIKAPDTHVFVEKVLSAKNKKTVCNEHYYQMQFNLFVTDRKWCDYVLYNVFYSNNPIFIHRVYRDDSLDINNTLVKAVEEIKEIVNEFKEMGHYGKL